MQHVCFDEEVARRVKLHHRHPRKIGPFVPIRDIHEHLCTTTTPKRGGVYVPSSSKKKRFFDEPRADRETERANTHTKHLERSSLLSTQKRKRSDGKERERERESEDDAPKRSGDRRRGNDGVGGWQSDTASRWEKAAESAEDVARSALKHNGRRMHHHHPPVVVVVVVVFGPDVRRVGENVRFGGSLSRAVYRDRPAATAVSW